MNNERKIKGYKSPCRISSPMSIVDEGQLFEKTADGREYVQSGKGYSVSSGMYFPANYVESNWEPVYEEQYKKGDWRFASGNGRTWVFKHEETDGLKTRFG